MVKQLLLFFWRLPRSLLIEVITLYQGTLSPDHGPLRVLHPYGYCRHKPTCSMYAQQMLRTRGFCMGTLLTARRVAGCHPWKKLSDEKIRELMQKI